MKQFEKYQAIKTKNNYRSIEYEYDKLPRKNWKDNYHFL